MHCESASRPHSRSLWCGRARNARRNGGALKRHRTAIAASCALALALLAACGERLAQAPAAAPAASPDALLTDYKKQMLSMVAGEYRGSCGAGAGAAVALDRQGLLRTPGQAHDLMAAGTRIVLTRSAPAVANGGLVASSFSASGGTPGWAVAVSTGRQAAASAAGTLTSCDNSSAMLVARNDRIYPAFGALVAQTRAMYCVEFGKVKTRRAIHVEAGDVRMEHLALPRKGITRETVEIAPGLVPLRYEAAYLDGSFLSMGFDQKGGLSDFILFIDAPRTSFFCTAGDEAHRAAG